MLGAHPATAGGLAGIVIRTIHPDASRVQVLLAEGGAVDGVAHELARVLRPSGRHFTVMQVHAERLATLCETLPSSTLRSGP